MSTKRPSPLVGYNTGVVHLGVPFHVQTEDSGVDHPHVITHLFAEGGHVVATRKTSYAELVGTPAYPDAVRALIRSQHKQMLVALRDGGLDALIARLPVSTATAPPTPAREVTAATTSPSSSARPGKRGSHPSLAGSERSRDSLDEIILADLVEILDE